MTPTTPSPISDQAALLHRLNDATKPVDAADRNLIIRALSTAPTTVISDQAAGEPIAWSAKQLYDAIAKILLSYQLSNWQDQYDCALGLVDRLCDHDAKDIASGQHQVRLICDEIYNEVLTATAPTTGSAPTVYLRQSSEFGPWLETGKDDPFAVAFVAASPAASAPKPVSELESTEDYLARRDRPAASVLTFLEVGTTERGSAINAAMQFADQTGFTRGKFQWCSAYADALVRTLAASIGGEKS